MAGKRGGFWDDLFNKPFGGLFDFNGDGKEDLGELWLGHKIFEEVTKEDKPDVGSSDFDDPLFDDDTDYSWRYTCEDGSEYGIFPENYDTEFEYEEALKEAKYAWRDTCEDGLEFGVIPENYETKGEYEEALKEAKYAWRDICEDGSEYGLSPEDYETEEEYEEALHDAKYGWRETCEDGFEYGLDPEDYETEEEYEEALDEAKDPFGGIF